MSCFWPQPIGTLDKLKKKDEGDDEDDRDARLYVGGTVRAKLKVPC